MNYLELGPSPIEEECVQLDPNKDYISDMKAECRRFKALLDRTFPNYAENHACFAVKRFEHDFGTYYEVVIFYDEDDEESEGFAYEVERNIPLRWDSVEENIPLRWDS